MPVSDCLLFRHSLSSLNLATGISLDSNIPMFGAVFE